MKKITPLCLCALLVFTLASCRGVAEKPFADVNFIPGYATIISQTPGHVVMEAQGVTLKQVIEFYELAIAYAGAQQLERDDTRDGYWSYTGTYDEGRTLQITIRDTGGTLQILVGHLDEVRNP
ncbi:MAG: hypothetical protein LBB75_07090 [Oscillospiraceae bacterium]|nr:hypothetical protein [Oscillospiraceae bacterium]